MALGYDELFEDLGVLVKHYNAFAGDAQGLAADVDEILAEFADTHQEAAVDGLRPDAENDWLASYVSRRSTLAGIAAARLTDRDTVLLEIGATSSGLSEVLAKFIEQMDADSESINASASTVGSVSAHGDNLGNGTILVTPLLDRVTSPGSRAGVTFPAHHMYGDLTSELVIAETMTLRCASDSFVDRVAEGAESFLWEGELADAQHGVASQEGSGSIGSVTSIHGNTASYLANADFESFAVADTPDNWEIVTGTAGTHINESSGSNAYHGSKGLNFTGDGALATIEVSQAIPAASVTAGKRYCVTARVKADATIAAGTLTIILKGTGYTAATAEKIEVAHGSLPTSWTLYHFFVLMPLELPSDLELSIAWGSTPTDTKNLYIDDIGFGEVTYGAGLGVVAVRGSDPFVRNDRYSFTIGSVTEGVFQKFFRQVFGVQLPSDDSAAETQADSLAT